MKPILFNTEMALALLAGRKTQTRRVVKPQPAGDGSAPEPLATRPGGWNTWGDDNVLWPSYQPGVILYVRETWAAYSRNYGEAPRLVYKADMNPPDCVKWRPSIHMPKEAARIFLRVTDVRVERLQGINTEDIKAEGINVPPGFSPVTPYSRFADLWDSTIKLADLDRFGWNANPWVWVFEFERITREEAEAALKEADHE